MVPYEGATEGVRIQNPGKPASKYADVDLSDNDDQWWRGRQCRIMSWPCIYPNGVMLIYPTHDRCSLPPAAGRHRFQSPPLQAAAAGTP